jgi:DNA repair photolyase
MPLTKSRGNMYPWVTHTHAHLGGECPHECSYCYVGGLRWGLPAKYIWPIRLLEEELGVNYGSGRTIFIEHCNDLFAELVPSVFILAILRHCKSYPNTYVFQTKNPARLVRHFLEELPAQCIVGATIESDRHFPEIMGHAPPPSERCAAMVSLGWRAPHLRTFVTCEPILDFNEPILLRWLHDIGPEFVNIGADSKRHGLPEPPPQKIRDLVTHLPIHGVRDVRIKSNLSRLIGPLDDCRATAPVATEGTR